MVEGDDRLSDLPVCSTAARGLIADALAAEKGRPMTKRDDVAKRCAILSAALPHRRTTDEEAGVYFDVMAEALEDVPEELFAEACRRAARHCRFMPSPAEIRALVKLEISTRRWRMFRMGQIVERHDREGPPAGPAELVDGAEMTALLSDVRRSLTARGERVPATAEPAPMRQAGPPREPTAADMAEILGITVEEAQARMDRAAQPAAAAPPSPQPATAISFAVRAYCDAIEAGASMTDPEMAAFYEVNAWAIETENERRMLAGEPRKQRAA